MTDFIFEHASCLREHSVRSVGSGGGIAVIVQERVLFHRQNGSAVRLIPGLTLFCEISDDVPALVRRHLWGPTSASILRQAVAWHLSQMAALARGAAQDEAAIDSWLDDHVAFVVGVLPDPLRPEHGAGALLRPTVSKDSARFA